jgi:hypothetical protein
MGLCIALKNESGEQVDLIPDEKNLLARLIDSPDVKAFPMLASIDKYGDTIFNRMQIERFLTEWETLFSKAVTAEEKTLLKAVKNLGEASLHGVHQYLVFIGD